MKAPLIPPYWRFNAAAIASADSPRRSRAGFSITNTMPALELFMNPFTDIPGKAGA
ncbi:hypothetical protein BST28156_06363 [Burkholderia stagnalis]|nr:hypothetical protein BST28156_06363 [Burkholderia stagnalis]